MFPTAYISGSETTKMAGETLSLLDYLRRPNPTVNSDYSWTGKNTKSSTSSGEKPRVFVEWTDFNYGNLQATYGDLLKRKIYQHDVPDFQRHFPFHLCEIQDEDSLEALLVSWNNAVVSYALSVAQRRDLSSSNTSTTSSSADEIFMARGGHAYIPDVMSRKGVRPDWAGIMPTEMHQRGKVKTRKRHLNVLPGDSKLSTKWSTSMVFKNVESKKPFFQIYRYCALAGVRYGYLLTQKELVVVRLSRKRNDQAANATIPPASPLGKVTSDWKKTQARLSLREQDTMEEDRILEYKSIPWESEIGSEDNALSINLALWWLHMLAARGRSIDSGYPDLREEHQDQNTPQTTTNHSFSSSKKHGRESDTESDDSTDHSEKRDKKRPSRKMTRSFTNSFSRSFNSSMPRD